MVVQTLCRDAAVRQPVLQKIEDGTMGKHLCAKAHGFLKIPRLDPASPGSAVLDGLRRESGKESAGFSSGVHRLEVR